MLWFTAYFSSEFLMSGLAAKYLVLNNAGSLIPTMAMSQLRTHFLGRVADPLEVILFAHTLPFHPFLCLSSNWHLHSFFPQVGITVEGLQEMFAKGYPPDRDWETDYDFKEILKTVNSQGKENL